MSMLMHSKDTDSLHRQPITGAPSQPRQIIRVQLLALLGSFIWVGPLYAASNIVISQIYGGGGNSGATLTHDFIEIFNRSNTPTNVNGWSVQYAASTGTGWAKTNLPNVTLSPGQYLLVQQAQGAGGSVALPTPDVVGTTSMSATAGKIVLRSSNVTFASGTVCPVGVDVVDVVGYGPATTCSETSPTSPNLSNTTSALRASGGCVDTDSNLANFSNGSPTPRNSVSSFNVCSTPVNQPIVPTCPATLNVTSTAGGSANISATDADGVANAAQITSAPVTGINLINVTAGSPLTAQLDVDNTVANGNYGVTIGFSNTDANPQTASCTINVNVTAPVPAVRIRDIQGLGHISPYVGQTVANVSGVVTVVRSNGFWMQDSTPDSSPATSEGMFVFTSTVPTVAVGDAIQVGGTVVEFRPGGANSTNLTTTELVTPTVTTVSTGNPLPPPTLLGIGGRAIPTVVIDDDATGNVETSGSFDPVNDGIDFYESLEGMRVQLNHPVASGPTSRFGEISLLADRGANAGLRTPRGGIVISNTDFNPERIIIDDVLANAPVVNVGDELSTVVGVMDYSFGNFKLLVTSTPTVIAQGLTPEITTLTGTPSQLTVGAFNVENLDPADDTAKFNRLANQIVTNLNAPDIVALMEVQDNNGPTNSGVVEASTTFNMLINAIVTAGGPSYQFRNVNPVNNQDGGEPGGNIRVGFLFNAARVSFVDRPGADALTPNSVVNNAGSAQLQYSPGRIDPTNSAFNSSRKPLAGEFMFNGHPLFLIANHFNSKGGDDPLFGVVQPPVRSSEAQRHQQAAIVSNFVHNILAVNANANVVVLGDLNDFEFSQTVNILKSGSGLVDLVDSLPPGERYTYVFDGNSQVLDHILVSANLAGNAAPEYDIVHVNSEFAVQTSDHEPEVMRLTLATVPSYVDVTNQVTVYRSGLTYKRSTQTFAGTLTLKNTSTSALNGPLQVELQQLTSGVTLSNATGNHQGNPYLTVPISKLAPGSSVTVNVQFSNPNRIDINYGLRVYTGTF